MITLYYTTAANPAVVYPVVFKCQGCDRLRVGQGSAWNKRVLRAEGADDVPEYFRDITVDQLRGDSYVKVMYDRDGMPEAVLGTSPENNLSYIESVTGIEHHCTKERLERIEATLEKLKEAKRVFDEQVKLSNEVLDEVLREERESNA